MNLLFDLGNSYCKYAIEEQGNIVKHASIKFPSEDKISIIDSLLKELQSIQHVVVCSVQSEKFNQHFSQMCNDFNVKSVYFLQPAVNSFGVSLAYADPKQLGADRLSAMLAVAGKYAGRSCVIDCGTAITIDVLEAGREHLGGVIFPGLNSMQQTLSINTEIKHPDFGENNNLLANTTQDGIHAGCLSAVVGGIEYIVNTLQETYDSFDQIVITGGDAQRLMSVINITMQYEPTLVLDGLLILIKELRQ